MKGKTIKTNLKKRMLSLVLAVCMLAGICPQPLEPLFAAAAEDNVSLIYDMRKAHTPTGTPTNAVDVTYDMTTVGGEEEMNTDIYSDPWKFGNVNGTTAQLQDWSVSFPNGSKTDAKNIGFFCMAASDYSPTIIVKVPEGKGGKYRPAVTFAGNWTGTFTSGAILETRFGKGLNSNGVLVDANVIAKQTSINTSGINGPMTVYLTEEPIDLEPGEYAFNITWERALGAKKAYPGLSTPYFAVRDVRLVSDSDYNEKIAIDSEATAETYVYDFTAMSNADMLNDGKKVDAIKYADTVAEGSAPWATYSHYAANPYYLSTRWKKDVMVYKAEGAGLSITSESHGSGTVMIHVPVTGKYVIDVVASNPGHDNFYSDIYLMPLKANRSVGTENTTHAQDKAIYVQSKGKSEAPYTFNGGSPVDLKAGEYVLHVYSANTDETVLKSLTLTPYEALEIKEYNAATKNGETTTTYFTAAKTTGATVSMEGGFILGANVADESVATVSAYIEGDKIAVEVTGGKENGYTTANIMAITSEGEMLDDIIGISVNSKGRVGGENPIWDFRKGDPKTALDVNYFLGLTYGKVTAGGNGELNPELYSEPWAPYNIVADSGRYTGYLGATWVNMGFRMYKADYGPKIKVKLNESGKYIPQLTISGTWSNTISGLNTAVYLYKLEGTTETPIASVSGINTAAIEGPIKVQLTEEPIDMEAGEYVIKIQGNGIHPDAKNYGSSFSAQGALMVQLRKFELLTDVSAKLAKNETQATKLVYDFAKLNNANTINSQTAAYAIRYEDTIAAGSAPWEIYSAMWQDSAGGKKSWAGQDDVFRSDYINSFLYTTQGKGLTMPNVGGTAGIMFHVPADGYYSVNVDAELYKPSSGNWADVYLYKLSDSRAVDKKISYRRMYSGENPVLLNDGAPIKLEAGEYLLYGSTDGKGAWGITFNKMTLNPAKTDYSLAASSLAVKPRATVTGTIDVLDENGEPIAITSNFVSASVADENIAEMTADIQDGKVVYSLTGKATGETTVDIVAIDVNNIAATATVKIYVNTSGRVGGESIIYDFRKANIGDDSTLKTHLATITYENTTAGSPDEYNPQLPSEPWQSYSLKYNNDWDYCYVLNNYQNAGIRIYSGSWSPAIDFKVTKSGTYMPIVHALGTWAYSMGGLNASFKLSKVNADGSTTDISRVDRVNGSGIEGTMRVEITDAPIEMEEGEYRLTVIGNGLWPGEDRASVWLQKLELAPEYEAKLAKNEVAATSLNYDFTVLNDESTRNAQDIMDSLTYADSIAAGSSPWKLYTALLANSFGNSKFFDAHERAFLYTTADAGISLVERSGGVMLHVPTDGDYIVSYEAQAIGSNASGVNVSFHPLTSKRTVEDRIYNESISLTTAQGAQTYTMNGGIPYSLAAGEYLLFVYSAGGSDLTINNVKMSACNIESKPDDTPILTTPRTVTEGSIDILDKNGNPVKVSGGQVWLESSDTSIVEITGEIKDGKIAYTMNSKGAGKSTIDIFVLDDNEVGTQGSVDVYVNANARFGAAVPTYDFRKANVGADPADLNYMNTIEYSNMEMGNKKEINPGMYSEPWAAVDLYSQDAWNYVAVLNQYQNMGIRGFNLKSPRSLKIRVNEAGTYVPTLIIAGTWENLAGMNAQFEFGYNSLTGYKQLGFVKGVSAGAIDGYFEVELTDEPIEMVAGGEYQLTITSNGFYDPSRWDYHSIWLESLELRAPRNVPEENVDGVKDLVYDFTSLNDADHLGYQDAASAITYADSLSAGSAAWEVYSAVPQRYVGYGKHFFGDYEPAFYYDKADRGLSMIGYSGAVRVHVPVDGWYTPSFELSSSGTSEIGVYFMPLSPNGNPQDEIAAEVINPSTSVKEYKMNGNIPMNLKAGEYILFIQARSGNDVYLNKFTLDNNNAVLSIKEEGIAVKTGQTTTGEITVYNGDSENSMAGGKLVYTVADPTIGDFNISISGGKLKYTFKSTKRGNTSVQISAVDANDNGVVKTLILAANPEGVIMGDDQYYNFRKLEGEKGKFAVEDITDIAMTTAGSASEINPEVKTQPWSFISGSGNFVKYTDKFNGIMMAPDGASTSFKIKIGNSGSYQVIPEATQQAMGALVDVYIAPVGAENVMAPEYLVGTANTFNIKRVSEVEFPLTIKDFDAGEYIVTFKVNGKSQDVAVNDIRADIVALKLKAVDYHSRITVVPESYPAAMAKGSVIEIPLTVTADDEVEQWTPAVDGTVTSSDSSVAVAEVVSSEDKLQHTLKITALKAGSTILTLTVATETSDSATITIPVRVTDTQAMASRTYKYRFKKTLNVNDDVALIDCYEKVTPGSLLEHRDGSGTDRWYVVDWGKGGFRYYQDREDKPASVYLANNLHMFATLMIELPESGIYQPQVDWEEYNAGGEVRMWIAPKDAEDHKADEWSVGTIDTYSPNTANNLRSYLRSVYLTAGEYKVTWEIVDYTKKISANADVPSFRWNGVDLVPMASHPTINLVAQKAPVIEQGTQAQIALTATVGTTGNGNVYQPDDLLGAEVAETSDLVDAVLVWDDDDKPFIQITGIAPGSEDVSVALMINGEQRGTVTVPVTIATAEPLNKVELELYKNPTASLKLRDAGTYIADLLPTMYNTTGNIITAEGAEAMGVVYKYTSSNENIATIDENGAVTPLALGNFTATVEITIDGVTKSAALEVRVHDGKTESTYHTAEKRANAIENINKYDWAKNQMLSATKAVEKYLEPGMDEYVWNLLTTQELPRSYYVGSPSDPDSVDNVCRYCGARQSEITGERHCPWIRNVEGAPWKLQCTQCRRRFPSNDFGKFYEIGIDEHGNWSYEQAKRLGQHLLTNDLYPEKGPGWGVDDGYGYDTGIKIILSSGKESTIKHTYIACYNHWAQMGSAVGGFGYIYENVMNAYNMTGDIRYGRLGAILTDRYADIYPDFDLGAYDYFITTGEHYIPQGKLRDYVWESGWAQLGCRGYDTFYDMFDDPYVISFISKKAWQYDMLSPYKDVEDGELLTSGMIREHCELGLVRETHDALIYGEVNGNFGTQHDTMAKAAVILDEFPETQEWIDWIFATGGGSGVWHDRFVDGGDVDNVLINETDRDGHTDETAPNYSVMWANGLANVAETLSDYEGYSAQNLFENPRYVKVLAANMPLVNGKRMTVPIGDSGSTASTTKGELYLCETSLPLAWRETNDPFFAQALYFYNGNSSKDLRYDIYTKNPERLASEIQNVIDTEGEYDFFSSKMLAGYGFAALRSGTVRDSLTSDYYNNSETFWIHFGKNRGHAHGDAMNLGIDAFGLDIAPDLGYPISSIGDECSNWGQNSISHNTVIVDKGRMSTGMIGALPLHFDDAGRVKVMDSDAGGLLTSDPSISKYRRTVVMIQGDEESSYGVDFFNVVGGNEHVYSFHALSEEATHEGFTPVAQVDENNKYIGTYAGADIEYKKNGIASGYSYLYNIDKAANPNVGEFAVDFKIKDERKALPTPRDINLRVEMLNEDPVEEITLALGEPAANLNNPSPLKYMLVRNMGGNSMFTAVMEPYTDNERYIAKNEQIPRSNITYADGSAISASDIVRAIKVTLVSGRVDYILYAQNNGVEYKITDTYETVDAETGDPVTMTREIAFQGFVGVYSLDAAGNEIYSYICDGVKLQGMTATPKYTGKVNWFTKGMREFDVYINVSMNGNVPLDDIIGRFVYIDKEAYEIKDASKQADDSISLYLGNCSLIKSRADDGTLGYWMKEGDEATILLSKVQDSAPVFITEDQEFNVTTGHTFNLTVQAQSPVGKDVTYTAVSLPRGASFNEESGVISWKPDSYQIGKHLIAISASDGEFGSVSYFTIEVFKSSGGSGSLSGGNAEVTPSTPSTPGDSGSGSAGGGGSAGGSTTPSAPSIPSTPETPDKPDAPETGDGEGTGNVPETPAEKFVDLGNHTWAKDAIYSLVDKSVVNGTSANTYSPANNIKRADFAIMLVRAFGITEGEGENFADVDANKYYAEELRLAKANGIVNGVGNDKFNPEGEITRQDMMLMLTRALDAMEVELSEADREALADFADAAQISDYAADAVSRMIKDGFIAGANGKINPLAKATRAEIAVMLDRVLAK